jgi:beta-lactamase class A
MKEKKQSQTMQNFFIKHVFSSKEHVYKYLSAVLFVTLCVLGAYIYMHSRSTSVVLKSASSYLNPALAVLDKRNLIVDFQPLREKLQKYEERQDHTISVYFEYFPTGANIATHKDVKIWPASLIKIPVAMAAMKKVQDGDWKLDNELVILDQDKDSEFGDMYKEDTGTTHTILRFFEESLINSDNTAHFVLLRNLEGGELEEVFVHLGMDDVIEGLKRNKKDVEDTDNRITAKRYSIFFRSLYNATFLDQEYSQLFLKILQRAPREYLSLGLPEDIVFVHKTGIRIDEKVMADSGIVYVPGRPYLLTVMISQNKKGDLDKEEIQKIFKEISEEVYRYVSYAD